MQYICDFLLNINERGRWADPSKLNPTQLELQDEEIFQTARIVKYFPVSVHVMIVSADDIRSCGHFMSMIFGDYVAGFLGLGRDGNSWSMNPFDVSATAPACLRLMC